MKPEDRAAADDRVQILTRVLAAIIVPVLIAAFVMLYFFPHRTGALFAWPIQPSMTAMMLGATYLGGAYFFLSVLFTKRWHEVKLGLLPVSAFAAILGLSTILHWDRFTHGHISFQLWALLYFSLPFVIPVAWYRNRSSDPGRGSGAATLPRPIRGLFAGLGALLTVVSVLLLLVPQLMIPTWPWPLTPLTARVMAAMFVLPGLVGIGLAMDGRWSAVRRILQAQALSIMLILLAVVRAQGEFAWSRPASWLFTGGLMLVLALIVAASARFYRAGIPAVASP